jgi:hypothetical protein
LADLAARINAEHEASALHIGEIAPDARLRSLLQIRLYKLQAALVPARPADLARAVTEMLLGFGSARVTEADAEAVVTQYVAVLAHLPLWAVQTACGRFASGHVAKAQCRDWKAAYAPTTAQRCRLAEALVAEYWREEARIRDALEGIPAHRPSLEEHRRVAHRFEQLQQQLKSNNAAAQIASARGAAKAAAAAERGSRFCGLEAGAARAR